MTTPIAFDTGAYLPANELAIPLYDSGFIFGVTISEQLRTFGGKLFQLDRHLSRLARSLEIIGLQELSIAEIADAAGEVATRNHALLAPGDDLGLAILVSPGASAALAPPEENRPRVRIYSHPLPFSTWHKTYDEGVALSITDIRQTPANCWPPELKCRSRMHYYLADQQAKAIDSASRAIILDQDGSVLEATTANLLLYHKNEGLLSPPIENILPGVSLSILEDLAKSLSIPFHYRRIAPAELEQATEVMLCSTSPCIWPVVRLNGKAIGRTGKETLARRLLDAWSTLAGLDIARQAAEFSNRPSTIG